MLLIVLRNKTGIRKGTVEDFKKKYSKQISDEIELDLSNLALIEETINALKDKHDFIVMVPPKRFRLSDLLAERFIRFNFYDYEIGTKLKILDNKMNYCLFDFNLNVTIVEKIIERATIESGAKVYKINPNKQQVVVRTTTALQLERFCENVTHLFLNVIEVEEYYDLPKLDSLVKSLNNELTEDELNYVKRELLI